MLGVITLRDVHTLQIIRRSNLRSFRRCTTQFKATNKFSMRLDGQNYSDTGLKIRRLLHKLNHVTVSRNINHLPALEYSHWTAITI